MVAVAEPVVLGLALVFLLPLVLLTPLRLVLVELRVWAALLAGEIRPGLKAEVQHLAQSPRLVVATAPKAIQTVCKETVVRAGQVVAAAARQLRLEAVEQEIPHLPRRPKEIMVGMRSMTPEKGLQGVAEGLVR
jgi:Ni,Fe-hydrogenase III small subunit